MQDAAMRRRIAALVIAALLAVSGAALTAAVVASDAQAAEILGTEKGENASGNTGNANNQLALVGSSASDRLYGLGGKDT